MNLAKLFTSTCDTKRKSVTIDSQGTEVMTFTTYLTGLKCSYQSMNRPEVVALGRKEDDELANVYFPGVPDIIHTDKLTFEGVDWEIVHVDNQIRRSVITQIVVARPN